jgi:peptidoglycan hydrolase CwlO-like protein
MEKMVSQQNMNITVDNQRLSFEFQKEINQLTLAKQTAEAGRQIAEVKAQGQYEQIDSLKKQMAQSSEQIDYLKKQIAQSSEQIASLNALVQQLSNSQQHIYTTQAQEETKRLQLIVHQQNTQKYIG